MKIYNNIIKLCLYVTCGFVFGKGCVYLLLRLYPLEYDLFDGKPVLFMMLTAYLVLLVAWSFIVLLGVCYDRISKIIFLAIMYFLVGASSFYMAAFYFLLIPDFEPYEFVYVVNDMAMYGLLMGVLSLIVGKENISGIMNFKLSG